MTALAPSKPATTAAEMLVDGVPGWLDDFGRQHALDEAASLIEQQTRAGALASDLAVLVQEFAWQRDRLRRMLEAGKADEALAALRRMGEGNHALIAARKTLREMGHRIETGPNALRRSDPLVPTLPLEASKG